MKFSLSYLQITRINNKQFAHSENHYKLKKKELNVAYAILIIRERTINFMYFKMKFVKIRFTHCTKIIFLAS